MPTTIYFSGSISGGRHDVETYRTIVAALERAGHRVLAGMVTATHIGDDGEALPPREIFARDMGWLAEAANTNGVLVAEVSRPSLGVGYEIAAARYEHAMPVFCLYRPAYTKRCSGMIGGDEGIVLVEYAEDSLGVAIERLLAAIAKVRE